MLRILATFACVFCTASLAFGDSFPSVGQFPLDEGVSVQAAFVPDLESPQAPQISNLEPGDQTLVATWGHPNPIGEGVTEYLLQYQCPFTSWASSSSIPNITATQRLISGLVNGTPCSVRVAALDASNNISPWSNVAIGTPQAAGPPAATITNFQVLPPTITAGQSIVLLWDSQDAIDCTTSQGGTTVWGGNTVAPQSNGIIIGGPSVPTVFGLTCQGAGGPSVESTSSIVTVNPGPVIDSFSVNPASQPSPSSPVTITWQSSNTNNCTARNSGGVSGWGGSVATTDLVGVTATLTQDASATLFLRCNGASGTITPEIAIFAEVTPGSTAPTIESFTANPISHGTGGGPSDLIWTTTNADECVATQDFGTDFGGSTGLAVSANPSTPFTVNVQQNNNYYLTCTGPGGNVSDSVQVFVSTGAESTFTGPCEVVDTNGSRLDDCYETRAKGLGGVNGVPPDPDGGTNDILYDANWLIVEDWDKPQLWDTTNHANWVGDGPPHYGPPYDDTGFPLNRGFNSYLSRVWGGVKNVCLWPINEPPAPNLGNACNAGGSGCYQMVTVNDTDPYEAKNHSRGHCVNIVTDGGTSFTDGTNAWEGGPSPNGTVFGNASPEWILHPGAEGPGGGEKGFTQTPDIGVTFAVLFSETHPVASGNPWGAVTAVKGDEIDGAGQAGNYWWGWQTNQSNPLTQSPYSGSHSYLNGGTCTIQQVDAGEARCCRWSDGFCSSSETAPSFLQWARTGWTRPADYWGKWHCIRMYMEGTGTANARFRMWDENAADNAPIIDAQFSGTGMFPNTHDFYLLNLNYNVPTAYSGPVSRAQDNLHVRAGYPVGCSVIGFPGAAN